MEQRGQGRYQSQKRRKRNSGGRILIALLVLALLAALLIWGLPALRSESPESSGSPAGSAPNETAQSGEAPPVSSESGAISTAAQPVSTAPETSAAPEPPADESWKLLLVNKDHPLPKDYQVELKALRNGHQVDVRIYPELQQMFDDARAAGIYPLINESYRSAQRQQQIMDSYVANYQAQGMSREEAEKKARTLVAEPGTSEHELGLALDIINEQGGDDTPVWNWLRDNCWRYGFILRYPADKEAVTGIRYEPWHFRYVGREAAREIMEQGLCLEEYLEQQP